MDEQLYINKWTEDTNQPEIGTIEGLRQLWFKNLEPVEHDEANKWVPYRSDIERYKELDFYMNLKTGEVDVKENWECDFLDSMEKYFSPDEKYFFTHFFDDKENIKDFYAILQYDSETKYNDMILINNSQRSFLAIQIDLKKNTVIWQTKIDEKLVSEIQPHFKIAKENFEIIAQWLKNNSDKITQTISIGYNDLIEPILSQKLYKL